MDAQKISVEDFKKISIGNDYYLWSFLQKKQHLTSLTIWSVVDGPLTNPKYKIKNHLLELLEIFPIRLYESYTEDSVDFLMNLGIHHENIFIRKFLKNSKHLRKEQYYNPHIFLFKGSKLLDSTLNHCYCVEGVTKMLIDNAPKFVEELNLD